MFKYKNKKKMSAASSNADFGEKEMIKDECSLLILLKVTRNVIGIRGKILRSARLDKD